MQLDRHLFTNIQIPLQFNKAGLLRKLNVNTSSAVWVTIFPWPFRKMWSDHRKCISNLHQPNGLWKKPMSNLNFLAKTEKLMTQKYYFNALFTNQFLWFDSFNTNISSSQNMKSYCGDKLILRKLYLYNGIFYISYYNKSLDCTCCITWKCLQ